LTPEELEKIVFDLLAEGVPPSVVARALNLDAALVKQSQHEVRIKRYGTDDLTEYNEQLLWDSIERAREVIAKGSATERDRLLGMVLGKQIALTARRTPEGQRRTQDSLLTALEDMRAGPTQNESEESPFVVRAGGDT